VQFQEKPEVGKYNQLVEMINLCSWTTGTQ